MIDVDVSKYTEILPTTAADEIAKMIAKPPTGKARTILQTAALAHAYASMRRRGARAGVSEKQLAIISYLTRNPSAYIFPEPTVMDALDKAHYCLQSDVEAAHVTLTEFARRY